MIELGEIPDLPTIMLEEAPMSPAIPINMQTSAKGKGKEKPEGGDQKIAQKWHLKDPGFIPATKCKFYEYLFIKEIYSTNFCE